MSKYGHVFPHNKGKCEKRGCTRFTCRQNITTVTLQNYSVLLKQAFLSLQLHLSYLDKSTLTNIDSYLIAMQQRKSGSHCLCSTGLWWQCFIKYFISVTKVAHWLTTNIDIVRTRVWESTDVDGIPVANIAIKLGLWFIICGKSKG